MMKVKMKGRDIVHMPITSCTGYVAESIEITPGDITAMMNMLSHSPQQLNTILAQLKNRFPSERAGNKN